VGTELTLTPDKEAGSEFEIEAAPEALTEVERL
jgi:hypothetical protein